MRIRKPRNCRKSHQMSVLTGRSLHAALLIVVLVGAVVLNLVADSRCTQVRQSIGEKQKLLARLEKDRQRESAAWEMMVTDANLERALLRHGLNMSYPKSEQIIRMDASGTPRYGQRSVDLAKRRLVNSVPVASNSSGRRRTTSRR